MRDHNHPSVIKHTKEHQKMMENGKLGHWTDNLTKKQQEHVLQRQKELREAEEKGEITR